MTAAQSSPEAVFLLWCRLTGNEAGDFDEDEHDAFLARPQIPELAATPYSRLLDAGITAARRGSLPLEHWLRGVQDLLRPDELARAVRCAGAAAGRSA